MLKRVVLFVPFTSLLTSMRPDFAINAAEAMAPTAALQEFFLKHAANPKAFADPVELLRQK